MYCIIVGDSYRKKKKNTQPRVVIDIDSLSDSSIDGEKKVKKKEASDDSDFVVNKKKRKRKRDTSYSDSDSSVSILLNKRNIDIRAG